jgi:hypothetical protein
MTASWQSVTIVRVTWVLSAVKSALWQQCANEIVLAILLILPVRMPLPKHCIQIHARCIALAKLGLGSIYIGDEGAMVILNTRKGYNATLASMTLADTSNFYPPSSTAPSTS